MKMDFGEETRIHANDAEAIGSDLVERLGADRVLEPAGSLPQSAERLEPSGPCRRYEIEVRAERLCLDSTSHRQIRDEAGADPTVMADMILVTVAARGKMHNAATDSGGVLLGTVTEVGESVADRPETGTRVVTLASLTLTPLRLRAVTGLDPDSAQVEVDGTAYICDRAPWAELPDDLPLGAALDVFDVCSAASHVRELAPGARSICVLGAGHAGKLALAAARDAAPEARLAVVDVDAAAVERATGLGLADIGVATDLRDPIGATRSAACRRRRARRPDRGGGQCHRLRARRDPDDGRRGDRPLLLDGDQLLGRGADLRRPVIEREDGGRNGLRAGSRRLRARPRPSCSGARRGDGGHERSAPMRRSPSGRSRVPPLLRRLV